MDIISHTLTGIAVGTVVATISDRCWKGKSAIIFFGAVGGALPDLDAVSLWSKFDSTLGSLLNLQHTGKEIYFGKLWYSHHAFLHSVLAPVLILCLYTIYLLTINKRLNRASISQRIKSKLCSMAAFFFAFIFHLLEDMPTPASVWGGVNFLFPSSTYVGGYGKIWWWNNYDLVLIIVSVILLNLLINLSPKYFYKVKCFATTVVFLTGLGLFLIQINTRTVSFSYEGHTAKYNHYELQSKLIQKEILGERLFTIMSKLDARIPLNF